MTMTQEDPFSTHSNHKILIIFYSRTGKTRIIAETIKDTLGVKLQEIIDLKDRTGFWGYMSGVIDIFFWPITEILPKEFNFDHYDLLLIGSPVWGNKFPPAITTFFSRAQFSDKKVVLFADFGSHMKESIFDRYRTLINERGGEVIDTFKIKTRGKCFDTIKNETKQILAENAGRWNVQNKVDTRILE